MKTILRILLVIVLIVLLVWVGLKAAQHFGWFGLTNDTAPTGDVVKPTNLKFDPNCQGAILVPGSNNSGRVELNLDNGDSHSWSVSVVNPDAVSGEQTLVVVTEPLWSFDIEYPVMYFTGARYDGTQEQVLCSANKLAEGTGELYVYAGVAAPKGWYFADAAVGPWWSTMTVWQYEAEAIDAGKALDGFIGAQDEFRFIKAYGLDRENQEIVLAHAQLWRPGYPGKVVHPQIFAGYALASPKGWEGTYWTYAQPNEDIQARIVEATEKEVLPRDQIGTVVLLFCGPADQVPATSFEFNGETVTWVTNLEGWTCTPPPTP